MAGLGLHDQCSLPHDPVAGTGSWLGHASDGLVWTPSRGGSVQESKGGSRPLFTRPVVSLPADSIGQSESQDQATFGGSGSCFMGGTAKFVWPSQFKCTTRRGRDLRSVGGQLSRSLWALVRHLDW